MGDLSAIAHILQLIEKGQRLNDIDITFPYIQVNGVRYDKCTAGYYYMPWLHNKDFLGIYAMAERIEKGNYNGLYFAPRAYVVLRAAEMALDCAEGDFVECGVFRGGTALLASEVILRDTMNAPPLFHLFDTFSGVPSEGLTQREVADGFIGKCSQDVSLDATKENLNAYAGFLRYYPGYIPDTFDDFEPRPIRYLHIDINTKKAHRECLEFFVPMLVDGAVILFDDYGWPKHAESKTTIDEYFNINGMPLPVALMTGQSLCVYRKARKKLLPF
jgi:hypothetical protein